MYFSISLLYKSLIYVHEKHPLKKETDDTKLRQKITENRKKLSELNLLFHDVSDMGEWVLFSNTQLLHKEIKSL